MYLAGILLFTGGDIHAADLSDIEHHASCKLCGMDRNTCKYSRVLIDYDNGSSQGFCSLHCAAADLAVSLDKTPRTVRVADFESKQLINAESAFWVVGGRLRGVMTGQGKMGFFNERTGGGIPERKRRK
jgi:nitrous oxide reductase accessory protein NosL